MRLIEIDVCIKFIKGYCIKFMKTLRLRVEEALHVASALGIFIKAEYCIYEDNAHEARKEYLCQKLQNIFRRNHLL